MSKRIGRYATVCVILIGMALTGLQAADENDENLNIKGDEWRVCQKDSECIRVESACPNFYWSINKNFFKEYEKQNAYLQSLVECGPPPKMSLQNIQPRCENGLCVLPLPEGYFDKKR